MATLPDGLNKPLDRIAKDFADEAPRLFLQLLEIAPASADIRLTSLRPETAPSIVLPDYVAELSIDSAHPFTFHVEFYLDYGADVPRKMARYGGSLAWQYQRRVVSILMLLRPDRVPDSIPAIGEYSIGETCTTHPYKVVRTWEIDPAPVFESPDPRMLPWAVLMKSTDEQVRQIGAVLRRKGDGESIARFLTLGSLRYHRSELEAMLEGAHMGLVEAILEGSSLVKEAKEKAAEQGWAMGMEKGLAEGRVKGWTEGQSSEARRLLRSCLAARFPGLETLAEIDAIAGVPAMESLLLRIVTAADRDEAMKAIMAATQAR